MKKRSIAICLLVFVVIIMSGCGNAKNDVDDNKSTKGTPEYYGDWELLGLSSFNEWECIISINEDGIVLSGEGQTYGPLKYTESFDSDYTYLELLDSDAPYIFVLLNDDTICMFYKPYEELNGAYIAETPWGDEFRGTADIDQIFKRKGTGQTSLPEYVNLEKMFSNTDYSSYSEYIYYPSSRIFQVGGEFGVRSFYLPQGGGAECIGEIALLNLDEYRQETVYNRDDIFTDCGYVITEVY